MAATEHHFRKPIDRFILSTMKLVMLTLLVTIVFSSRAQNITAAKLQTLLDLPLDQAVQRRTTYKEPLNAAYNRQLALAGKDCEAVKGQQPYNICMGQAEEQADKDYAIFYNNLRMLCHDQGQLKTLQSPEFRDQLEGLSRKRDEGRQGCMAGRYGCAGLCRWGVFIAAP